MKRSKVIFLSLAIILIISLSVALSFYIRSRKNITGDSEVEVQVIIDFGTLKSTNNHVEQYVNVTEGTSALDVFSLIAELTVVNYPFGAYVKGVDGYMESLPDFWGFYYYNYDNKEWAYSAVGVSNYYVEAGDRIKLHYSG